MTTLFFGSGAPVLSAICGVLLDPQPAPATKTD
jgi:hypothetical protein